MKRLTIALLAILIALAIRSAPASVAVPIRESVARSAVDVVLSVAPASGTTIVLDLPAELVRGEVPVIEKPGQPHRMGVGRWERDDDER